MSSRLFRKEEVEGKTVVYSSGWVAGKVKDVVFGLDGTLILVVQKEDSKEIRIPVSAILGVADYVIARDMVVAVPPSGGDSGTDRAGQPRTYALAGNPALDPIHTC